MSYERIKDYYRPIQPTVTSRGTDVIYVEYAPATPLTPFIHCIWELKTLSQLKSPFVYRVVADGCIDIFFEFTRPTESFVMGFSRSYTEFEIGNSFHFVGIRFLPSMFPQLFSVDASTLSDTYVFFNDISPSLASHLISICSESNQFEKVKKRLEDHLIELKSSVNIEKDPRLYDAIIAILQSQGLINISKDIDTGISLRQLRRLFSFYIGDSPKTFSKVVRFQNILSAKPSTESLRRNKLFYDVGYYDQAHFIKDFKNFYGVTPSHAFGR